MKPEVQWYLVEALANARAYLGISDDYETKQNQLSHFAGVLAGFRYLVELTQDEEHTWYRKMLVAQGYEPPEPAGPGVAQFMYLGDPNERPVRPVEPESAPAFLRSHPGPDQEFDLFGGRLRVLAVEVYDTVVVVRWRVAPEPDIALAFPEEAAALEQDIAGLEDWAADELQKKAHQMLRMWRLYKFDLTDDAGTPYFPVGSGHTGRPHEMTGEARFQPAPPSDASTLVLSWLDLEVPIPLS